MTEAPPAIPAATLILMRPGAGAPELLAMERAAKMAFAPGAVVFPGGRVEEDDHVLARRLAPDLEHGAARVTAIRETIEEVGVAVALSPDPDATIVAELRAQLRAGTPFSQLIDKLGLMLDLQALTPFGRWCPPFNPVRRFDTLFFVAEASSDAAPAKADRDEAAHCFWASARHILNEAEAGKLNIIFPTKRNLDRLAQFDQVEQVIADAAAWPLHLVEPQIEMRGDERWLCIPEGIGYPVTSERLADAKRG